MAGAQLKAPVPESLAASGTRAETIGGEASGKLRDTTSGDFRAIGDVARDVLASLHPRQRVAGTLRPRWPS